ncbi:ABC transporter permease [Acidisoma silvae]|uniref:ABC transporter permease n=1 Tax=Acidisoma silvae TaxID=2802396 RepID=A0A963YTS9_9PROT|nr:ABC transporter permease [Acidisoma silvae]MCB8876898.1 ABC transporter permease [Acidisoma silvae]
MRRFRERLGDHIGPLCCAIGVVAVVIVYAVYQPAVLSAFGIASLANASVTLALAGLGQTVVLMTGALDLSIGSEISLVNCFAATFMGGSTTSIVLVVVASLLIGLAVGAINGLVVAYGRVAPLIATFCTSFVYAGISLTLRPQPGGSIPDSFANLLTGNWGLLPFSALLLLLAVLVIWLPVFRSRLGRFILAYGDNPESAFASGIPVRKVGMAAYMLAGLFAAIAGLFLAAETTSGDPSIGNVYTLNSLAAAVLGGVALTGGRGGMLGPILGAILLSIILNVLSIVGISAFWQDFIEGGILMLVLGLAGIRLLRAQSWMTLLGRSQS